MANSSNHNSRRNAMERKKQLDWHEEKELYTMQGWGYKSKLTTAASPAFRSPIYWFRTRSFCVRSPYG